MTTSINESPLRLDGLPLAELTNMFFELGIELCHRALTRQPLELEPALAATPDRGASLRALDCWRPQGIAAETGLAQRLIQTMRNVRLFHVVWWSRSSSTAAISKRREKNVRLSRNIITGPARLEDLIPRLNELLATCAANRSGCRMPATFWDVLATGTWTNPEFQFEIAERIQGTLRTRVLRGSAGWDDPHVHPNTIWALILLSRPGFSRWWQTGTRHRSQAPRRMIHVLKQHATRCRSAEHWAGSWDQWLITEALQCPGHEPDSTLLELPMVCEWRGTAAPARQRKLHDSHCRNQWPWYLQPDHAVTSNKPSDRSEVTGS